MDKTMRFNISRLGFGSNIHSSVCLSIILVLSLMSVRDGNRNSNYWPQLLTVNPNSISSH